METNSWSAQTTTLTFWGDQQEGKNKGFAPGRGRGFGKWATGMVFKDLLGDLSKCMVSVF